MRPVDDQHPAELGGPRSVLVKQRADHAELDRLLEQLPGTTGTEQDALLTRLWRLVFPHAYAEETVLWPVLRRVAADGERVTAHNEREHQEVNELVSAVERTPAGERGPLLTRVAELLRQDVRDEEELLLPRLRAALDDAQLQRLGLLWDVVRHTAPTRPHAVVSRRPPGNVLAALPLAVLDRSRDRLDMTARASTGPAAATAVAVSRALAATAGAVERVPLLRVGQDASTRAGRTAVQP